MDRIRPDRRLISIDELVTKLTDDYVYQVDAREWASEWTDQWVAFVDLIGFGAVSQRSPDTVLNWVVRFHRILNRVKSTFAGLRMHQFTDAAYLVSPSAETLIKCCSDIQHLCLAMNIRSMQAKVPQWHYMLAPRITIAYGHILLAADPIPPDARYDGIDPSSLMAGDAVVSAYSLEKRTAGSLISVGLQHADEARKHTTQGNRNRLRTLVERWVDGDQMLIHDGVLDVPWLALRAEQPETPGLWTDDLANFWTKVKSFRAMWELHVGDYVRDGADMGVVKHYGGSQRHLAVLVQMMRGNTTVRPWNVAKLDTTCE